MFSTWFITSWIPSKSDCRNALIVDTNFILPLPTRQKQYFEQRKRQQQLEEHSPSVSAPYTRSHENNRSLDVLSLLNLSKNGQDCTSRFPEGTFTFMLLAFATLCSLYCLYLLNCYPVSVSFSIHVSNFVTNCG